MKHTIKWLFRVMGRKKGYLLALTLSQGAAGVSGVLYALLLRSVVDSAALGDGEAFFRSVLMLCGLAGVQLALSAGIRFLHELSRADIENTFKQRLTDSILRKEYAFVSAVHTAEWMNRLTNDTVVVASGLSEIIPGAAGTAVRLVSALIMLIVLDRWFAAVMIPGGALLILLTAGFRGVLRRLHRNIQERDGALRVFLQERISNLMVIKAFTAEKQAGEGAARAMEDHKKARLRRLRFSNAANAGFGAAMQGMYLAGIVYCAHGILMGRVTYGTLTAVMQLIAQVQGPFASISAYVPRWYAMTASAERLMEIEACADEMAALPAQEVRTFYRDRFSGIELKDASFSYPSGESGPVLSHVDLKILKGQYIAVTGRSGCGKSTLLKLLMCLYPLDAGERRLLGSGGAVCLDAAWRGLFAYVPQGNALMNGRIRDVVAFACPEKSGRDEELIQALKAACAEFVLDLEDGLDTQLGEQGKGLSEGQMQRLAIARALFSGAPILLLDEASSALDEETEKRLLLGLRGLTDRTVLIVTHRKAVLSICDRVLTVTENGVEEGAEASAGFSAQK